MLSMTDILIRRLWKWMFGRAVVLQSTKRNINKSIGIDSNKDSNLKSNQHRSSGLTIHISKHLRHNNGKRRIHEAPRRLFTIPWTTFARISCGGHCPALSSDPQKAICTHARMSAQHTRPFPFFVTLNKAPVASLLLSTFF